VSIDDHLRIGATRNGAFLQDDSSGIDRTRLSY
jgi:hypothetical protein